MARLVTSGFEVGSPATFSVAGEGEGITSSGTLTLSGSARSGTQALSCAAASSYVQWAFTGATARDYYARCYLNISANPSASVQVLSIRTGAAGQIAFIRLNTDGTLTLHDSAAAQVGSASSALGASTYSCIELRVNVPAAGNGTVQARLNYVDFVAATAASVGTTAPGQLRVGNDAANTPGVTLLFDDVALNDSTTGGVQTAFPGAGSVIILKPISDNARTGWTAGAGGTTNLWDAVNNVPPVGVASASQTDTSQVKDTALSATDNYDANVQSYTTGGIAANDAIRLTCGVFNVAAASNATTNGAVMVVSNPADAAEVTADYWNGAAAGGTYPTGWRTLRTAYQYAPAVTRGTSPVIRFGRRQSTNGRTPMSDFGGVLVEYVPTVTRGRGRRVASESPAPSNAVYS